MELTGSSDELLLPCKGQCSTPDRIGHIDHTKLYAYDPEEAVLFQAVKETKQNERTDPESVLLAEVKFQFATAAAHCSGFHFPTQTSS